jgi:hypothetical protein
MPRHVITPAQIATARTRVDGGDTLSAVAKDLGLNASSLSYHLRGGKGQHYSGTPWRPHVLAARKAIGLGRPAEAAYHFRQAAEVLIKL